MRVPHEVNLDGVPKERQPLSSDRYRVYWTRRRGVSANLFGVADTIGHERGLPAQDFVLLDAEQSGGLHHARRVAAAANALDASATAMGLRLHADALGLAP